MADPGEQSPAAAGGNARIAAYALAVLSFFALGFVVYRDEPEGNPAAFASLSESGRSGFLLWRQQNCHTCHQLYGFGGYLGPDLTHAAARVTEEEFEMILHAGVGQMPPIRFTPEQKAAGGAQALYSFLTEMSHTGRGHMGLSKPEDAEASAVTRAAEWEHAFAAVKGGGNQETLAAGAKAFTELNCKDCHRPLRLGRLAAPDLTRAFERLGADGIADVLIRGRGNMPPVAQLEGEGKARMQSLIALLRALNDHRAALVKDAAAASPIPQVPWWNFDEGEPPASKGTSPPASPAEKHP